MANLSIDTYMQHPYPFFARQRQLEPLAWVEFLGDRVWLITGYEEAEAMLKDARFIRDSRSVAGPNHQEAVMPEKVEQAMEMKHNMILVRDAPFHTRVRGLLSKAFTPGMINRLRGDIAHISLQLLQDMRGRHHHELIADYAYKLPMYVISDLIGVPKEDRQYSRQWSEAFVNFIDFHTTLDDLSEASDEMLHAREYFHELIKRRRLEPQADLISQLASLQAQGGDVADDEIVASCVLLLSAGHETTVNLIANGYYLLLKHPEQYEMLRQDPTLMTNAIEEILRYEPPAFTTSRWVSEDMMFYGKELRRGQFAMIALGGVNRDPRIMNDPDRFDIARSPVKHLSFAAGAHFCLGGHLARLEGQIALEMLVRYMEEPALLEEPTWKNSIALRGFERLRFSAGVIL